MTFKVADRVKESCISPGTGTVALLGAITEFQSFSSAIGANNTTYYVIADQSGGNWEVGLGTVGATGLTLARTAVLASSNSGSLVNFLTGSQYVWVDYPAIKAVLQDPTGVATAPVFATNSSTSTTPTLSFNGSNSAYAGGATIANNYLQFLLQNKSGTSGASTNYVVSNDLGTDSSYYGEFGMNSSAFSASTPSDFFSLNNGVYFSGHDGDITVGSGNGFKYYLAWGTTGQSAHVINASGALGFSTNLGTTPALSGTTGYGIAGQVPISAGSGAAPTWGTLGISAGGTGQTTAAAGFNALSPITITGDLIIGNGTNSATRLGIGANGYVLTSNGTTASWQSNKIVSGTAVASTSGTAIDFTSIPSWVKRITVMFNGVSTNSTSVRQIQLGYSGGVETTGYTGSVATTNSNGAGNNAAFSGSGFALQNSGNTLAADTLYGNIVFTNVSGNIWTCTGILVASNQPGSFYVAGVKTTSGVLTTVRITTVNGTDTFDAGSINILYE